MAADPWAVVSTQAAPTPASTAASTSPVSNNDPWAVVSMTPANQIPPDFATQSALNAGAGMTPFGDVGRAALGLGETALSAGTGTLAQIVGGLTGLGTAAANGLGLTNASPSDVIGKVENFMTYRPVTPQGQSITNAISNAYGKTLGNAASWSADKANNAFGPLAGAAMYTAINALPMALGAKEPAIGDIASESIPSVANAINLGYKLKPSEAGGGAIIRGAEGLSGAARLEGLLNEKNQAVTNSLVSQDLGLPPNTRITSDVLDHLREPANSAYEQVSALGNIPTDPQFQSDLMSLGRTPGGSFPLAQNPAIDQLRQAYSVPNFDSGDALLHIRNLRKNGYANIKAGNANIAQNAPMTGELGHAQVAVANALENQISRALPNINAPPDLITQFQNARQQLAKINTVDNALIGDTGNVSAQALAKQANKGAPLSGNLAAIAQTANDFPHVTRDVEKVRNFQPFGSIHGMGGGGMLGGAGLMELMHNPGVGLPMLGAMASTPLVRRLLSSDFMQQGLANPSRFRPNPLQLQMARRAGAAALVPEMSNQNSLTP